MKKVAFVCPDAFTIWIFRKGLAKALMARGFTVYVLAKPDEYVAKLEGIGVVFRPISFDRFMSAGQDLRIIRELWTVFRQEKFDVVHNFTIKPNVYGSVIARLAGTREIYNSVTGLGYVYRDKNDVGLKRRLAKGLSAILYRIGSAVARKTWFQNQDDIDYFLEHRLIRKSKTLLVRSSGINTNEWCIENYPNSKRELREELGVPLEQFLVIMVGRALKEKGIDAFIDAASALEQTHPNISFVLVGGTEEDGHLGRGKADLERLTNRPNSNFFWLGHRHDVKHIHAAADLCVLPSYYREGVPRSLLESMAMGKPIITTDSVGCREAIVDGHNGFKIPIKDSEALTHSIQKLHDDPALSKKMGENSLSYVKSEFDEQFVVSCLIKDLYNLPDQKGAT